MASYAIGDIQGCYDSLQRLLDKLKFDPAKDTLWFAGDLVNRGPDSLSTLRLVKSLANSAITVLGNHDLHLLAIAAKHKNTKDPGLKKVLKANDAEELLTWLRKQPLLHHDAQLGYTMAHAGIYPGWNLQDALCHAAELEKVLRSENYLDFIFNMYGNLPEKWHDELEGWDRLRFICNSFTRMRYCEKSGKLNFKTHGAPGTHPKYTLPWFDVAKRKAANERILFGHWSTLGKITKKNIYPLDTGCIWGGELTALSLKKDTPEYISITCPGDADPAKYV